MSPSVSKVATRGNSQCQVSSNEKNTRFSSICDCTALLTLDRYRISVTDMGVTEITIWMLVRRYDKMESQNDILQTSLHCFNILPGLMLEELKMSIYYWANVEKDTETVLKIRGHDGNLIPLSSMLRGSRKDRPFIIDIVGVHQFCTAGKRTIPRGCIDALKVKLNNLEKRVIIAESHLTDLDSTHTKAVEMMATQLASCVSFLDRRLDELSPSNWKNQIETTKS